MIKALFKKISRLFFSEKNDREFWRWWYSLTKEEQEQNEGK